MKTQAILRHAAASTTIALATLLLGNCASVTQPVVKHDLDGDGLLSDGEYRQANAGYNLGMRDRVDEYGRARLVTAHVVNARDALAGASDAANILQNFAR